MLRSSRSTYRKRNLRFYLIASVRLPDSTKCTIISDDILRRDAKNVLSRTSIRGTRFSKRRAKRLAVNSIHASIAITIPSWFIDVIRYQFSNINLLTMFYYVTYSEQRMSLHSRRLYAIDFLESHSGIDQIQFRGQSSLARFSLSLNSIDHLTPCYCYRWKPEASPRTESGKKNRDGNQLEVQSRSPAVAIGMYIHLYSERDFYRSVTSLPNFRNGKH